MMLKDVIDQYVAEKGMDIYPPGREIRKNMIDRFMICLTKDEERYVWKSLDSMFDINNEG